MKKILFVKQRFFGLLFLAGFFSTFYLLRADDVVKLGEGEGRTFVGDKTITGDITLTSGGSILSTANGDITFTPNGTGDVNWTSQNSTMTTAGALTIGNNLTVSGNTVLGNAAGDTFTITGATNVIDGGGATTTQGLSFQNFINGGTRLIDISNTGLTGNADYLLWFDANNNLTAGGRWYWGILESNTFQDASDRTRFSFSTNDSIYQTPSTGDFSIRLDSDTDWYFSDGTVNVATITSVGALTTEGLLTVPNITLGSQGVITGSIFAVIPSSSITNTTNEIDLFSTTINGNTLGSNGCIKIKGVYTQTESNANTKTIRVYYGASVINSDVLTTPDARSINHVTCNTTNSSTQKSWVATANSNSTITTTAIDSTVNQTYRVTGQLQVATDTMTWTHGFLEIIK